MHTLPKFAAAILVLVSLQTANAQEIAIPANRETAINFVTGVTDNCHNIAKPKMKVARAPAHGTVRFQWVKYKIQNFSRICNGRPAWGMAVLFTPTPGYRGKDGFTFGITMEKYEGSTFTQYKQDTLNVLVK
ncbi:hypothetical protein OE766_04600 [Pararhizobium sp. YC-54]|uniref:hypothetical protein n=1 Tax=Pararhizobium sp. YC-54 TaxID=2986920 RepID=UPI0021F7DC5B|nr:hypothetical protein [Pararhizobium sp. YC-54]MCV9997518.1 hypothetical protein [Pararhizobium sp. YC-54]